MVEVNWCDSDSLRMSDDESMAGERPDHALIAVATRHGRAPCQSLVVTEMLLVVCCGLHAFMLLEIYI
jgi:hypothetical protein